MTDTTPERGREHRRRIEDREARKRGDFVAFAACSHERGQVLKVAVPDQRRRAVTCPVEGCAEGAHGTFMPRPRRRDENCELESLPLDDGTEPTPDADDPTTLHGAQRVTDAAIFAAIPAGSDVLAGEVAEQLGYHKAQPLLARMRRMNERATASGDTAPFVIEPPARGGGRALLRRAES